MGEKGFFKNSIWGLASNIIQNVLLSVFFLIIARKFEVKDFSNYLIANSLYQVISSFSALGLGQWFIRQLAEEGDLKLFLNKFLKIQIGAGIFFYIINIIVAWFLYDDDTIKILAVLMGINIVFDNIIYTVKNLNIAQFEQNKTFIVLIVEAVIKVILGVILFIYPYSIIEMAVFLVLTRVFTLNLFLRISTSRLTDFKSIISNKVSIQDVKSLIIANWPFIIVGSISIIYWRIGSILISKFLSVANVATYEIAYKFFSLAQIIPVIVSASIFPELLKAHKHGSDPAFQQLYKLVFKIYLVFGFLAFTFIYSFADPIVSLAFGENYADASFYTKQMFLTMLVFPTALLQANILIILKLEKKDMWFNIISFLVNLFLSLLGFIYFKSLSVINISIFASFIIFHLLQDYVLVRKKIAKPLDIIYAYLILLACLISYIFLATAFNNYLLFISFWILLFSIIVVTDKRISGFLKQKLAFKQNVNS